MTPAIWGLLAAVGWGGADYIGGLASRAIGHRSVLLAMLAVGAVVLGAVIWAADMPLVLQPRGLWLVAVSGLGVMAATLWLYHALARGPITVVAPIVGTYPAFNLAFAVALGARPSLVAWTAMATVLGGVVLVARSARAITDPASQPPARLRRTIALSLSAALGFAIAVAAAQQAALIYGELQTVWLGRCVGVVACAALFLAGRERPRLPLRWWPYLAAQGLLDAGAYGTLLAGSDGPRAVIAVVVASAFSAVTILLARLFLRETMNRSQWLGIAAIIAGVMVLSSGH
ncbi:MAG TPA: EamA family transporter [Kiloniellales bacterium]